MLISLSFLYKTESRISYLRGECDQFRLTGAVVREISRRVCSGKRRGSGDVVAETGVLKRTRSDKLLIDDLMDHKKRLLL